MTHKFCSMCGAYMDVVSLGAMNVCRRCLLDALDRLPDEDFVASDGTESLEFSMEFSNVNLPASEYGE